MHREFIFIIYYSLIRLEKTLLIYYINKEKYNISRALQTVSARIKERNDRKGLKKE